MERSWLLGTALVLRDIEAFDEDNAFVMSSGEVARIYRTRDGGRHWEISFDDSSGKAFLDSLAFWSRDQGLAFSDPVNGAFVVLRTVDGRTWSALPPSLLPLPEKGEGGFAASGSMLVTNGASEAWIGTGGSSPRVFHTLDQGDSWAVGSEGRIAKLPSPGLTP